MPLSDMVDQQELIRLFSSSDPADKEKLKQLGPGFTDSATVEAKTPEAGASFSPMATSLSGQSPAGQNGGSGGVQVQPRPSVGGSSKPGFNWSDAAGHLAIGLSDIGNVVGNPRARYTPESVEMLKEKFKVQQMDQLQRRHAMWDDVYKQSQALPQEVLTDPKFAPLAQAKAALDKDLADGKIDNEKNVSTYLVEQQRVKKDLEEMQQANKVQEALKAEGAMAEGRTEQQAGQVQKLQAIVADPNAPPELKQRAAAQLSMLPQAQKYQGRDIWSSPLELSKMEADDKYKARNQEIAEQRNREDHAESMARIAAMAEQRQSAHQDKIDARESALVQHLFQNAINRHVVKDMEKNVTNAEEAQYAAIDELAPQLIDLAKQKGISIRMPQADQGGFSMPGAYPQQLEVDGQQFKDKHEAAAYLLMLFGG